MHPMKVLTKPRYSSKDTTYVPGLTEYRMVCATEPGYSINEKTCVPNLAEDIL